MKSIEDHLIEQLVDLEYDVLDALKRINYITEELKKLKKKKGEK